MAEEQKTTGDDGKFKSIRPSFLERSYFRYTLWTGIYMLDTTEAAIANAVFLTIFYYSCRCLYYLVSSSVGIFT